MLHSSTGSYQLQLTAKHTQRKQSTTGLSKPDGTAKLWRKAGAPTTCYFSRTRRGICPPRAEDTYFAKWKCMQSLLARLQIVYVLAPFFMGAHFPAWTSKHWFQQMLCIMERMQRVSVCSDEPAFIPLGCWRFYAEQLVWPPLVSETIGVLCSSVCLSDRNLSALWMSSEQLFMTWLPLSYLNFRRSSDPWTMHSGEIR